METRKYYEAYDERYKTAHGLGLQWSGTQHTEIISEALGRYGLSKTAKLLELGCGEGRDAAHLLERGFDLLATDISPTVIEYCRSEYSAYKDSFAVLDFVDGSMEEKFDFIYAVAVIHMLVEDSHRDAFYRFVREHLSPGGIALICTMGDGETEYKSDTATAFELQERFCVGQKVMVAGTSCRMVSRETLTQEINRNGLTIVEMGQTSRMPDFNDMTYAVVK